MTRRRKVKKYCEDMIAEAVKRGDEDVAKNFNEDKNLLEDGHDPKWIVEMFKYASTKMYWAYQNRVIKKRRLVHPDVFRLHRRYDTKD